MEGSELFLIQGFRFNTNPGKLNRNYSMRKKTVQDKILWIGLVVIIVAVVTINIIVSLL